MNKIQAPCGSTVLVVRDQPLKLQQPLTKYCKSGDVLHAQTLDDISVVCANCVEGRDNVVLDMEIGGADPPKTARREPAQVSAPEEGPAMTHDSLARAMQAYMKAKAAERDQEPSSGASSSGSRSSSSAPRPTVRKLLEGLGVPSDSSPVGRSRLGHFRTCMFKGYLRYVVGLERIFTPGPEEKISALDLGSLVHACVQRWYETGDPWGPVLAVEKYYPMLADETRRLTSEYLHYFNARERVEWDVRGTEVESRYYWPARKCAGKRRRLCITTRHDTIYRQRAKSEGCVGPGLRVESGLRLHELKTSSHLSEKFVEGYHVDEQVLVGVAAYNLGQSVDYDRTGKATVYQEANADIFGKAEGFTVTVIAKVKNFDPTQHLRRFTLLPSDAQLDRYLSTVGDWLYEEVGDRLLGKNAMDPLTWPPSWQCRSPITGQLCTYSDICVRGGKWETAGEYERTGSILRPEDLELQEKLVRYGASGGKRKKRGAEADGK